MAGCHGCASGGIGSPFLGLVVQDWGDGWACGYNTFAQCEAEARAGNTGYSAANPYHPPPASARPSRQRRQSMIPKTGHRFSEKIMLKHQG